MKSADQFAVDPSQNKNTFDHKEYNVTNYFGTLFCLFGAPYSSTFILEPEYVVREDISLCGTNRNRVAYGDVGVDKSNCLCCIGLNDLSPGCGCEYALVNEIAEELQSRIAARGQTGQMQKAEQTMQAVLELKNHVALLDHKLNLIMNNLNINIPTAVVTGQVIDRKY